MINTHYAVCDVFAPLLDVPLHCQGTVNFKKLLANVAHEGYLPSKNLEVFNDKLVFYLDNGNTVIVYIHTLH